jgi:hypothetical protein
MNVSQKLPVMMRCVANAIGFALAAVLPAACALPACAQTGNVPTSDREWELLRADLARNPYHLALLGRDAALPIVLAALGSRSDGIEWAAAPGVCDVPVPDRFELRGAARSDAFRRSAGCFGAILAALAADATGIQVDAVRSSLTQRFAEALLEAGELAAADSVAARELERTADSDLFYGANAHYDMNQVRGQVALRRGRTEEAVAYLHRAAETRGSPQLATFGPQLRLARELLEAGHAEAVRAFLMSVRGFWLGPPATAFLDDAIATIDRGELPAGPRWR